jgi:hypothetical protein
VDGAEGVASFQICLPLLIGELIQQTEQFEILQLIELGNDDHCIFHNTAPPKCWMQLL